MANKMVLRVQSRAGRCVLDSLVSDSTLWHLQQLLEGKTGIQPHSQKVLSGYPPKEISTYNPTARLCQLDLQSRETLIVSELAHPRLRPDSSSAGSSSTSSGCDSGGVSVGSGREGERGYTVGSERGEESRDVVVDLTLAEEEEGEEDQEQGEVVPSGTERSRNSGSGDTDSAMGNCYSTLLPYVQPKLIRKIVPADNSCLFRCISYLVNDDRDSPSELRQLAAGVILSNPQRYSAAVLGKSSEQYVQWLLKEQSWGGAIELSVFSEYYHIELDVVDVQSQRIDRFGEDRGYIERALLIYDGIHYDPLVSEGLAGSVVQKVFPVSDTSILAKASQLAREAYQARQFTDVGGFTLRCLACGVSLRGQTEAQNHATATGHINFGEI